MKGVDTMAVNVPKTDGRGIISGMYVNQNHPMDRTQWLEDTFPEWGSFLNQEIENYEVPKGQVSLWWCGGPSWVIKTDEGGVFLLVSIAGLPCTPSCITGGVCKQAGADSINWIRLNPQVIDPWKFNHIDGVFCTHAHQDHCDLYAVKATLGYHRCSLLCASRGCQEAQGLWQYQKIALLWQRSANL